MTHTDFRYGFRVVGATSEERRLVIAADAFAYHCTLNPAYPPDDESYLSAFRFDREFRAFLKRTGSTKGFAGRCWSPWLWFDIDRDKDLPAAHADAKRLVGSLLQRYPTLDEDDLLVFFSGKKGFHVGLPLSHAPDPSAEFPHVCRELAVGLATEAGVALDTSIYEPVRLFRAPNTKHPETGLHKRRVTHGELMSLSLERIRDLARQPHEFDVPYPRAADPQLASDWAEAAGRAAETAAVRLATAGGNQRVNRATLDFLANGAAEGGRHTCLFAAAADLAEHGVPTAAIHALLTEPALDTGLPPKEVARVIDNAADHVRKKGAVR